VNVMSNQRLVGRRSVRGAALITVLVFVLISSIILAGIGALVVSDLQTAIEGQEYDNAIYTAEAGINYELNKISVNSANADQKNATGAPGTSYSSAAGAFSVYVTQRNSNGTETTPWASGNNLYIYATGTINGISRQVKVAAAPFGSSSTPSYAVFGASQGLINGSPATINGSVGTNGFFTFNGSPTVTGSVIFNGSGSNWQSPPNGTYTVVHNSTAVSWPTVETVAVNTFGSTGLSYVASHNDNSLASPAIASTTLLINSGTQTFVGKAGGANYYLTSLTCNGSSLIYFNNTNGPITIWVGPSGTSSTFDFNGGSSAIKMSTSTTSPVKIYIATTNDVIQNGNTEIDAGIYNLNNSGSGRVILNGNPTVNGSIISNMFTFNGTPTINYTSGYFSLGGASYYGVATTWNEVGGFY